jgi:RNA polymerase subunit RPABC4/transcription elongation factor Spt4/uncharacterized membrane protein
MGKATGVGAIVFGLIMIFLGIGAYFSGEASSQTSQGRTAIGIVIILGLAMIYGGVSARQKEAEKATKAQQAQLAPQTAQTSPTFEPFPPPPPPGAASAAAYCPYCGRQVQPDFVVCPFCGKSMKNTCHKCGKQVQSDFVACPYCGVALGGPKS